MIIHKAARHLILAEATRAINLLKRSGQAAYAAEVGQTADCLEFAAVDQNAGQENSLPGGRSFLMRLVEAGKVKLEKQVPESIFKLYNMKAGNLVETGHDSMQDANGSAARALFREFHAARLGHALDDATESALSGESIKVQPVAPASFPRSAWFGLAFLCVAALVSTVWQGTRTFNFIDMTYLAENLNRLAQGQIPYRDFFLVLPPMHYWIHLIPFKISGGGVLALVFSGGIMQVLTILATYWVCQLVAPSPRLNLIFALIPAVMGPVMTGGPSYDCEAILAVTLAIGALLRAEQSAGATELMWSFLAGAATGLAILIKINIGVPLLCGFVLVLGLGWLLFIRFPWGTILGLFIGTAAVLIVTIFYLSSHDALVPALEQTLRFPAQTRLHALRYFFESLPWPRLLGGYLYYGWLVMLVLLWLLIVFGWFAGTHRRPLSMMLPVVLMAVVLGTMQSQLFASIYGLGPVAAITLAIARRAGSSLFGFRGVIAITVFAVFFSFTATLQDIRLSRLAFMNELLTEPRSFTFSKLQGLRGYAPTVKGFEDAVQWVKNNVNYEESVFWWPGTAPFYIATGRACPLPNFQVCAETGLSPAMAVAQLQEKQVRWVLVDRTAPRIHDFGRFAEIEQAFTQTYELARQLGPISIYRLKAEQRGHDDNNPE